MFTLMDHWEGLSFLSPQPVWTSYQFRHVCELLDDADCRLHFCFVCAIVWLIFVGVFSKCTDKYELLQRHIVSSAPSAVPWRGVWQWRGHKSHIMPNQNDESLHNSFKSFDLSSVCCIHCLFLKLKCRFMQIVALHSRGLETKQPAEPSLGWTRAKLK